MVDTSFQTEKLRDVILQEGRDLSQTTQSDTQEEPQKCMILDEIDDYSIKTVYTGEICTIDVAKAYGIFDKATYFNGLIPANEKQQIETYPSNISGGSNYSLCSLDNNNSNAYKNCVLSTKNPWKSLDESNSYCMLPLNITLPNGLEYNQDNKGIINKPTEIPLFKNKDAFCQNKFYDWFSIPDFHFGNQYSVEKNTSNVDNQALKCLQACELGSIPYNDFGNNSKCIDRNKYEYGIYKSQFYYLPISLILLLGCDRDLLIKMYKDSIIEMRIEMKSKGLEIDYDLYNDIMNNTSTHNNIYEDAKKDIREHLRNLLKVPIDYTNIMEPSKFVQDVTNSSMTQKRISYAYDVAEKYYNLTRSADTFKELFEWKKNLADICGFGVNSDKFYKVLLYLKQACNVAFGGKSYYSTNVILYNLNLNLEDGQKIKPPLLFEITEKDVSLASYVVSDSFNSSNCLNSSNSSNCSNINQDGTNSIDDIRRKFLAQDLSAQQQITHQGIQLNPDHDDPAKYSNDENDSTDTLFDTPKAIAMFLVFAILMVILFSAITMILIAFWPIVGKVINMQVNGAVYAVNVISDMFRGKYTASSADIKSKRIQMSFLNNQTV
jgi:hypothetical protein